MLNLSIVEDEIPQAEHLRTLVQAWAELHRVPVSIQTYPGGESFQFAWAEDKRVDVLLLDIGLSGMSGLELAKVVRAQDPRISIIFITGLMEFMQEGYEVSALHYLLKPVDRDKLFACLNKTYDRARGERPSLIVINERGEQVRLMQDELMVAEAFAHTVRITTIRSSLEVRLSIGEMEKALQGNLFIRCHRGFLVGLAHIARINREALVLDDGRSIPISRRLYPAVNQAFINFFRKEAN